MFHISMTQIVKHATKVCFFQFSPQNEIDGNILLFCKAVNATRPSSGYTLPDTPGSVIQPAELETAVGLLKDKHVSEPV